MILTDKQKATLALFASNRALSFKQVSAELNIEMSFAKNRVSELYHKGLLRKINQSQYQATSKGVEQIAMLGEKAPEPVYEAGDERPMTNAEMDRLLDAAVEEAVEHPEQPTGAPMTMEQFAELPADELEVKILKIPEHIERVERSAPVPSTHPAIDAIHELQERLSKPVAIEIDDLDTKKLVLIQLARILDPSISDVLVSICDDLDRATGNPL